jgi:Protein of unknown function (DUF3485)
VLFAGSGLFRVWQDRRYDSVKKQEIAPLFPLKSLPKTIGSWRALDDKEATLDPQIARVAGSVDSLVRVYVDDYTGVAITALILYGSAETITAHTPQVCYPAAGYTKMEWGEMIPVRISPNSPDPAVFAGFVFAKGAGLSEREEVYYSFRHSGAWNPWMEGNWRTLRYSPAVFKIQVERRVIDTEFRNLDNPSSRFLEALVPEVEKRVNNAPKPKA